ncbi:MAG: PAS domain S-box protein [Chloroflexota bacterium]
MVDARVTAPRPADDASRHIAAALDAVQAGQATDGTTPTGTTPTGTAGAGTAPNNRRPPLSPGESLAHPLFAGHPLPLLVYDVQTLAILDVNDAFTTIYGYSRAELLAMQIPDLLPPEDAESLVQLVRSVVRLGRPSYRPPRLWRHVYKDGRIRDVEVAAHDVDLGERETVLVVITDVTARLQAQRERDTLLEQLEREAAEKAAILEQMADGILVADARGHIVLANRAAHVLFDGRTQSPTWLIELDHDPDWTIYDARGQRSSGADRPFARALRGETHRAEFRMVSAQGRERWLAATASPLRDRRGNVSGVVWVGRDITEERSRRERETQDEKLRALGQMASGVAHDLNQYLGLVAGYGDLTARALDGPLPDLSAAREALDVVIHAAMDSSDTVKRLQTFAHPTLDGPATAVDVRSLLQEVVGLTAPHWRGDARAEGRLISVSVEATEGLVVNGWAPLLREALTSMVLNAVDALPRGGSIRLTAYRQEAQVIVSVTDNGVGISENALPHVLEPYFTTKGEHGTGLGLAVAYGIVDQHQGTLAIASALGRGTTVTVTLPAVADAPPPPRLQVERSAATGLRVLVVDDEPSITRMVSMMLAPHGHQVTVAATAEAALACLDAADSPFHLIISDLGLGAGMNGWELLDRVREIAPNTRFILSTGWGAQIDTETVIERGGEGLLSKPYRLAQLLAAVDGPA